MNAGLLTVLGKTGEGLAGGMTEAIKYEIMKRRDEALFQREKTLEEYRKGYSRENIELQDRLAGERSKESDIRKEDAAVSKFGREQGKPTDLEEKYNFAVAILGEEEAKALIRASVKGTGENAKNAKLKVDTLIKAYEMKDSGHSLEEVNAVLDAAGLPSWIKKKATEIEPHWYGDKKVDVDTFGPAPAGLLGGVPDTDITKRGTAESESIEGETGKTPAEKSFNELREKAALINGETEQKPGQEFAGLPGDGLLSTKRPIKRTKMIGSAPEEIEAEKEAGKQEMIALANKAGVGAKAWKETWRLYGDIAKWLWGSYDNFVGEMLKSQSEARKETFRQQ